VIMTGVWFQTTMKRKPLVFVPALLAVIVLVVLSKIGVASYDKTAARRGEIASTIAASGKVKSETEVILKFPSSGKLATLNVRENDRVKKGEVIATLESHTLSATLQKARNDLLAKQATAQKVLDEVKDHDKDETFVQKEKRVAAETARDSAYDSVKEAERALEDSVLTSPIDGIATQVNGNVGEWITALDNKAIAKVIDPTELFFEAGISQEDSGQVAVGQAARVELDAIKDSILEGTVYEVPMSTSVNNDGEIVVPIKIKFTLGDNLKLGYEGDTQIITKSKTDAILVPKGAVVRDAQTVYIPNSNMVLRSIGGLVPFLSNLSRDVKKVKLGMFDGSNWEILEGLGESEEILVKK